MHYIAMQARDKEVSFVLDEIVSQDHYVRLLELMAGQFCQQHAELFSAKGARNIGRKAYDPALLLSLLLYGYLNGISSSRKLELECHRNLEVIWLLSSLKPDHKTIANFRKDYGPAIEAFLKSFNKILRLQGSLSGESVSLDGSKLRAYASKSYDIAAIKGRMLKLEQKEQQYLQALELMDVAEDELEIAALQRDRLLEQIQELEIKQQELPQNRKAVQRSLYTALPYPFGSLELTKFPLLWFKSKFGITHVNKAGGF